jgi:RimJ/RimL family protein N-acetyltransferase
MKRNRIPASLSQISVRGKSLFPPRLKATTLMGSKVKLRPKKLSDARNDYLWQTDPELARLDAVSVPTIPFSQYLLDYSSELHFPTPTRHSFAIETLDGKHIGNCVYYNETKEEAELGIMIGNRDYWDKGYGTDALATLIDYIFLKTNLKRLYLKTLDWNHRAQKCFQKCGFTPYGHLLKDGHNFVLMELHRKHWEEKRQNGI